ncbi:PHB depolymerase family esterase [Streptomyces sp. NPDC020917]|uniref:extracellular catalytic domain type 1 short-chain-length polyhydroxyalkanoate depolymerase n=1 Tax=Streptomyces sp. NPDC020917 TaxID=3365102 RepID=UPI0037991DB9
MFRTLRKRSRRGLLIALLTGVAPLLAALLLTATSAPTATAASLTEVTGFGANPSNLRMYVYVPNSAPAHPAVLVAVHYCTGSGPAFYSGTEFASLADRYGFIVVYPSATRSGSCFDVSSPQALVRDGGSDPVGIMSMVTYTEQHYGGDASRVYVTGASSGGMMTNVLLGDYPDVFKAGAAFMGVPFGCFATTDGSSWNSACANGQITKTPQAWGDLARSGDPGYTGPRPRMQLWHGTADTTLYYANFGEEIKQWTNVLGVSQTPVLTDSPQSTWTRTHYGSTGAQAPVEAISIAGAGHVLPQTGMAAQTIAFFGLDGSGGTTSGGTTNGGTTNGGTTNGGTTNGGTTNGGTTDGGSSGGTSGAACSASFGVVSSWAGGYQVTVTVKDTGTAALSAWTAAWTEPQGETIANLWNAVQGSAGGQTTAHNAAYNGTLAPGASTTFGFVANGTAPQTPPAMTCQPS